MLRTYSNCFFSVCFLYVTSVCFLCVKVTMKYWACSKMVPLWTKPRRLFKSMRKCMHINYIITKNIKKHTTTTLEAFFVLPFFILLLPEKMFLPLAPFLLIVQFPWAQVPWIGNYKINRKGDSGKNMFSGSNKMKNDSTKNVSSQTHQILNN